MRYAVACGHTVTCEAVASVLRAGGSAVDAALAGAFAAMAAEPVLAGLLGGGFLMIREPDGRHRLLDAFVETPLAKRPEGELDFHGIHADFGTTTQAFMIGTGAIAVPGLLPGLAAAHRHYGRMPFRELVAPAVDAARAGVPISPFHARLAEIVAPILLATPGASALHADADGALLAEGTLQRNPDLADVLEVMGREGPRLVTHGEVAAGLLALAEEGGHLTEADLTRYRPRWREPLVVERGPARVALNPAPALGGPAIARILAEAPRAPGPVDLVHAFETAHPPPGLDQARRGTTHISVIDGDGLGAALTLSNGEGCGHVIPGTGIMPNNMLGEAALVPGGWHSWTPDTRLASMMAPTSITWADGRTVLLGSGGSNRIATALAQVILDLVDHGMPLAEAVLAPRLHAEAGAVDFEDQRPADELAALLAAHPEARAWDEPSMFFGGVHAARRDPNGTVDATGDPRRDGATQHV